MDANNSLQSIIFPDNAVINIGKPELKNKNPILVPELNAFGESFLVSSTVDPEELLAPEDIIRFVLDANKVDILCCNCSLFFF